jgi:hypothetical protein
VDFLTFPSSESTRTRAGELEDRGFGVLVDRDDRLGRLHARAVLDGTGDADRDVELAALPASETVTDTATSSPAPAAGSGANEFGRTVKTGAPVVTLDCTVIAPPKIDWVAPSAVTPAATP